MKKRIWAFILLFLTVGMILAAFFTLTPGKEEEEKEVYGPKILEQTLYEKIFTMLENTPLPTYHDDNGNPFKRINVSVDRNSEYDYIQIDVNDEKNDLNYLYMVCDFSFEYDHVKTNGELLKLNNKEIYKYNKTYAWHDEETGYYSHLAFDDGITQEEIEKIILSFGESEHDILDQLHYKKDMDVIRPTYAVNNEKLQSIVLEYTPEDDYNEGFSGTTWLAMYETYQIKNSFYYEYTSELVNAGTVSDKQDARKSIAMIDKKNNQVAYTDDEIGSLLISPYQDGVEREDLTGEFVKVIDSFK